MEGCYKLHSTDWLEGYPNVENEDIIEIRFKNTRRSFFRNVNNLSLKCGDIVAVEASPGHDIGIVAATGDMVARQMKRVGFSPLNGEFKKLYRIAKPYDIEKWQEAIAMEHETMIRARRIAAELNLNMKIGDVEYQGDKIKAIFYYIADERVDFRELIKVFADEFRIKIEMKQIGARQEAGRIGGLGSCGRELCCASWISSFVSVTTNAARTQEISLNPQKLAGQCSKLKCCLSYEFDTYMDARKEFPRINQPLQALDGEYFLVKTDILARTLLFSTSPGAMVGLVTLPLKRVKEILEINRRGEKVDKLLSDEYVVVKAEEPSFIVPIGEESLTRFDKQRDGNARSAGKSRGRGGKGRGERPQGERTPNGNNSAEPKSPQGAGQNASQPRNPNSKANNQPRNGNKPERAPNSGNPQGNNQQPKPQRNEGQNSERGNNPQARERQGGSTGGQNGAGNPQNGSASPHNGGQGGSQGNPNNRNRNRNRRRPNGGNGGNGSNGGGSQGGGEKPSGE